ncbi:MAG: UDP-N-acetylglucosamine 4,6-dehydratase (inverting) [Waddliaceae bacterium]|nr:UDP-N-acetylglucosamine 4,6-dehydratase (inverting) [Waddliaceae bacterium]
MDDTSLLSGKTVLITGGTGSFGRAFARKVLQKCNPRRVIIFSRDEWKQWEMRRSDPIFDHPSIRYFLGDVRDKDRLRSAFSSVDFVIHAAALKQVPAAEYNPGEFVKTNVHGAMNIVDAAIENGVERVIALSTDKAVNPVNLYGATKLCSDKLFVSGNVMVGMGEETRFSVVRYGNVLGSRGSIIPLWLNMLKEGASELPVTDERMTRFWISLEQTVDFVLDSFSVMKGGEIFVPKIPSMKIVDLAEGVAPGVPQKICGIREGEKLHELMISIDDARRTLDLPNYYVIVPEQFKGDPISHFTDQNGSKGTLLADGFTYRSDTNTQWLDPRTLRDLLDLSPDKPVEVS